MRTLLPKFMSRVLRFAVCLLAAAGTVGSASAFSGWAAAEAWQTTDLDYVNRTYWYGGGELGGTKNFGEFGRLNVPILTYGFDEAFLNYYGAAGEKAINAAIASLNAIPAASSINLAKYVTQGNQEINYTAEALSLYDLKSATMGVLLEHMGLIGETHVWDMRVRQSVVGNASACFFEYVVVNRNFDPQTFNPTAYVNGTLYTYDIVDNCLVGGAPQSGDAFERPADTTQSALTYTAVATKEAIKPGGFFLGLTRDDVGGLRYLYRKNNYNVEALDPDSAAGGVGSASSPWQIVVSSNSTTGVVAPAAGTTTSNLPGIYGGVEKITFVKVAYDSLLSTTFKPITYHYNMTYVTNGRLAQVGVTRTVTAPDIIFSAGDLVSNGPPVTFNAYTRGQIGGYVVDGTAQTSAGGNVVASVFSPRFQITFNSVGPLSVNEGAVTTSPSFLGQGTGLTPIFWWGSYDGSTNTPVLFPTGSSISALQQMVLSGSGQQAAGTWTPIDLVNTNVTTGGGGQ
jgi:hypothetical protein